MSHLTPNEYIRVNISDFILMHFGVGTQANKLKTRINLNFQQYQGRHGSIFIYHVISHFLLSPYDVIKLTKSHCVEKKSLKVN